jgi:hypothetical protein
MRAGPVLPGGTRWSTLVAMLARWLARLRSAAAPGDAGSPLELVLYTRAGCHLCDVMKAELARVRVSPPFRLVEVDIERDPELVARHGLSIPVVELAGRPLAKGRLERAEFERRYARHAAELARAGGSPRG